MVHALRSLKSDNWAKQAVFGLALFGACWALGAPTAAFYEMPVLKWLLPVAGLEAIRGLKRKYKRSVEEILEYSREIGEAVGVGNHGLRHDRCLGTNSLHSTVAAR